MKHDPNFRGGKAGDNDCYIDVIITRSTCRVYLSGDLGLLGMRLVSVCAILMKMITCDLLDCSFLFTHNKV